MILSIILLNKQLLMFLEKHVRHRISGITRAFDQIWNNAQSKYSLFQYQLRMLIIKYVLNLPPFELARKGKKHLVAFFELKTLLYSMKSPNVQKGLKNALVDSPI